MLKFWSGINCIFLHWMKKLTLEETLFLVKSSCEDNCHIFTNHWMVILTSKRLWWILIRSCKNILSNCPSLAQKLQLRTLILMQVFCFDFHFCGAFFMNLSVLKLPIFYRLLYNGFRNLFIMYFKLMTSHMIAL